MSRQTPAVCTQPGTLCLHLMSQFKKTFRHIKHKQSVKWVFNSLVELEKGLLASTQLRFHPEKKPEYRILQIILHPLPVPPPWEESVYNHFTGADGMQRGIPAGLKIMLLKWVKGGFKNQELNCSDSVLRMPSA